jgi:hypothetical protein
VDLQEERWESMDWIYLAQDWERWRVSMNAVISTRIPYKKENFLTS